MADDFIVPKQSIKIPKYLLMSVLNPLLYTNKSDGLEYIEYYLEEYFNEERIFDDEENVCPTQHIYICLDIIEKAINENIFNIVDKILERVVELMEYVTPASVSFDVEEALSDLLVHATKLRRNDMVDIMIKKYNIEYPDYN